MRPHRAEMDCLAGLHLLSQSLPISKDIALKTLLTQVNKKSYIVRAINSPFDSKDLLKAKGLMERWKQW